MTQRLTDNQTGARAAAEHIFKRWIYNIAYDRKQVMRDGTEKTIGEQTIAIIEAIILEHCPQDKAVGRLVKALESAISAIESLPDNIFGMNDNGCAGPEREEWPIKDELLSELQAALAEHERAQKQ